MNTRTNSEPTGVPPLEMWAIYENPSDHPGKYVARKWSVRDGRKEPAPELACIVGATLEDVRSRLPAGMHRMDRMPGDDKVIVETWFA